MTAATPPRPSTAARPPAKAPGRLRWTQHRKPDLRNPILIEGLPGVGHVGKLAAQHLVESMDATLWCTIHGPDLPAQVTVAEDGTARLLHLQLWTVPAAGKAAPLVILTGDAQPLSGSGQWNLVEEVLRRVVPLGCRELYTLGGYGTGTRVDRPEVLCAATDAATVARLQRLGLRTPGEDGPGGGIIGASGLFIGIAAQKGMTGACLMGETNGYLVDPKAARAVLAALGRVLGRSFDLGHLEETANELDRVTAQLQAALGAAAAGREGTDHYIG